jgi:hypothetical protein
VGDLISTVPVPALIIANDQEFVHPLAYALTLQSKLPRAQLRIITSKTIDACAHREEFAQSLREFLLSLGHSA